MLNEIMQALAAWLLWLQSLPKMWIQQGDHTTDQLHIGIFAIRREGAFDEAVRANTVSRDGLSKCGGENHCR